MFRCVLDFSPRSEELPEHDAWEPKRYDPMSDIAMDKGSRGAAEDDALTDAGEGYPSWTTLGTDTWSDSFLNDGVGTPPRTPSSSEGSEPAPFSRFAAVAKRANKKAQLAAPELADATRLRDPSADPRRAPGKPQLAEAFPSVGSSLHAASQCKPCAWFHKPGGCQNGRECLHCHLCEDGEHKRRKIAKAATMRRETTVEDVVPASVSPPPGLAPEQPEPLARSMADVPCPLASVSPPPGLAPEPPEPPTTSAAVMPLEGLPSFSVGARDHLSGECQPCAWFWKAQGCKNGRECRRCHLCPEGEVRSRKKAKATSLRDARRQAAQEELPREEQGAAEEGPDAQGSLHPQEHDVREAPESSTSMPSDPAANDPREGTAFDREPQESAGSAGHLLGDCRPCAWYWKPHGCHNGKECLRCHMCPAGAVKERKKTKKASRSKESSDSSERSADAQDVLQAILPPRDVLQAIRPPPGLLAPASVALVLAPAPMKVPIVAACTQGLMSPRCPRAPARAQRVAPSALEHSPSNSDPFRLLGY